MLCGWTTTSMASGATSKSQRASITSSPLFIRVAESIVILAPMSQVGWRSASLRRRDRQLLARICVAERTAGRGEHDSPQMLALSRPASAWKTALCSLSTGSKRAPDASARRRTSSPATTITSLLASAMSRRHRSPRVSAQADGADQSRRRRRPPRAPSRPQASRRPP